MRKILLRALFIFTSIVLIFFFLSPTTYALSREPVSLTTVKAKIRQLITKAAENRDDAPEKAIQYCRDAQKLLTPLDDAKSKVRLLNEMCWIYKNLGEYKKAIDCGNKSIATAEKAKYREGLASAFKNTGTVYNRANNYKKTFECYARALHIFKRLDNIKEVGKVLNNFGVAYVELGAYEKALDYFLKALKIFEEMKDKNALAGLMNNIGTVYSNLNKSQQALRYYEKALTIYKETKKIKNMADTLNNIGIAYFNLKDYDNAMKCYSKSLEFCEAVGHKLGIAETINNISECYIVIAEYDKAKTHLIKALNIYRLIGDRWGEANALTGMGITFRKTSRHNEAIRYLREALVIAKEMETREQIMDCYQELSLAYDEINNYKASLEYYRLYKKTNDDIFNRESSKRIAESEVKYNTSKKEKEIEILKKDREIQQLELAKQRSLKNFLLVISLLVVMLAFVIYSRYQVKSKMSTELLKSRKLESVGILAGGIAHDFNNLLVVIRGNLGLLKRKKEEPESVVGMATVFQNLEKATSQAADLAQKLTTFSNGGWLMKEKIAVSQFMKTTIDYLPEHMRRDYDLSIPSKSIFVNADERQLRQALQCLLINAAEADDQHRSIT
ncbi:MAG: tetratricopeptide repeat protein, partial [bacterium]|nr:tetratricopeptide repeat protein [bacterium]